MDRLTALTVGPHSIASVKRRLRPGAKMIRSASFLLSVVLLAGCRSETRLSGEVVDPEDKPIADVKVRLALPEEDPTLASERYEPTDESGRYRVGMTHARGDVRLMVTATRRGYKSYRKTFKVSEAKSFPEKIVLYPDPSLAPEQK